MKNPFQIADQRTHAQRVKWGLVMGAGQIADGVVSIVTLGHVWSSFAMDVAFYMGLKEHRKQNQEARA